MKSAIVAAVARRAALAVASLVAAQAADDGHPATPSRRGSRSAAAAA